MFSNRETSKFTKNCSENNNYLDFLQSADAVVIGAGAGLSASAGLTYSGERFTKNFADFIERYGLTDMYSSAFYPFKTQNELWAYWSRHIFLNRYNDEGAEVYKNLLQHVEGKNYFVITTNADHMFRRSGFEKKRIFYTQGNYGLWQCSTPCHKKNYDNKDAVLEMVRQQSDMRVPSELVPLCPLCNKPMTMNLRRDNTFVEDEGWHTAMGEYENFIRANSGKKVLFLELGIGANTPSIIKYPFWQMVYANKNSMYACVNKGEAYCPKEIEDRAICIDGDIGEWLLNIKHCKE